MTKSLTILLLWSASVLSAPVFAAETVAERTSNTANDAKRGIKKGVNRTKEAVCMKGDAKCAAEKAKHRVNETGEYIGDKANEAGDVVD